MLAWQANKQSDEAVKEKAFSALALAVNTIQQDRATILNALVRMRMRWTPLPFVGGAFFAVDVASSAEGFLLLLLMLRSWCCSCCCRDHVSLYFIIA